MNNDDFMELMKSDYIDLIPAPDVPNAPEYDWDDEPQVGYRSKDGYSSNTNTTLIVNSGGKTNYINAGQDYRKIQYETTYKEINDALGRAEFYIDPVIIKATVNLYHYGIQQNQIKRGNGKLGCHAACFHKICISYGVPYKHKEVVRIFDITREEISNGCKTLDELISRGMIAEEYIYPNNEAINEVDLYCHKEVGTYHKPQFKNIYMGTCIYVESLLRRYFEDFDIPIGSPPSDIFKFANRLYYFTIKFHISESSIPSSKCAGILYLIGMKYPEYKIHQELENICKISKSTYSRFVNNILTILIPGRKSTKDLRRMLRRLHKKYNVPL